MIIFPAVDIQGGNAVRLRQGRKEDSTIFGRDPVAMAEHWQEQGARWLHIVDLDGAFEGTRKNAPLIGQMIRKTSIPAQVGGGIRTLEDAKAYFDCGVQRVVIGTMALESPAEFERVCNAYPGKIGVSLDGENGKLKTRGWLKDSGLSMTSVLPRIKEAGAAFIVYTDIGRDGMQTGLNLVGLSSLLTMTDLPVIAAGGVACLEDIRALRKLPYSNLEGAISGKALYEGSLDLREAQNIFDNC